MTTASVSGQFDPIHWLMYGDRGVSSETIFATMIKSSIVLEFDTPKTPADFRRCILLLDANPEWRGRLQEVADRFPEWQVFVNGWGDLEALYYRDIELAQSEDLAQLLERFNRQSVDPNMQKRPGLLVRAWRWLRHRTVRRDTDVQY